MNILITICARGGSKGIPGKNIKQLCGKPLIVYTIELANEFIAKYGAVLELSTDSSDIKKIARDFGLNTSYSRPMLLAGDEVGKIDAVKDVMLYSERRNNIEYDYVLDLDVTSPLRNLCDIETAFSIIEQDKNAINLFSVSPASRNPYFNMVEKKSNNYYGRVKSSESYVLARQSAPVVYDMNASFYIYRRMFFKLGYKGAITDRSLVYEVPHICFDLDNPLDFDFLEFIMNNHKLDFDL